MCNKNGDTIPLQCATDYNWMKNQRTVIETSQALINTTWKLPKEDHFSPDKSCGFT